MRYNNSEDYVIGLECSLDDMKEKYEKAIRRLQNIVDQNECLCNVKCARCDAKEILGHLGELE